LHFLSHFPLFQVARGELKVAFSGNHGWFFRNRNDNDITLMLRTDGDYGELKRAM
jgi:hypothetical protein